MHNQSNGSHTMFDRIAKRYDRMNRILSLGIDISWRHKTLKKLSLMPNQTLLDLATGTADMALLCAKKYPDIQIIGIDPSHEMLRIGQEKIDRKKLSKQIILKQGDAQAIELEDNSVDVITIAFGLRNIPNKIQALREMNRVLTPTGRLAVLELTEPTTSWTRPITRIHIHHIVPWLGAWLSGESEYRYLEQSIANYPPVEEIKKYMTEANFDVLKTYQFTFGVCSLMIATPNTQ